MKKCIYRVFTFILVLVLMMSGVQAIAPAEQLVDAVGKVQEVEDESWKLMLVNSQNLLPKTYQIKLRKLANGLQVDERIYDDLNAMLIDCWGAGLHPIVCSAYRTYATQNRLHQNKIARLRAAGYPKDAAEKEAGRWVAVPGTSEHQTGLALDLISYQYQVLDEKQEETPEQKWFMEHCWDYGFILRYPEDKTEVTGIGYEPWHYRYVGREAAAEIKESGLCLEEYLDMKKTGLSLGEYLDLQETGLCLEEYLDLKESGLSLEAYLDMKEAANAAEATSENENAQETNVS